MKRVLILSASIGEGHDLPARVLADALRAEDPTVEVLVADGLAPMGRLVQAAAGDIMRVVLYRRLWVFDLQYALFQRFRPLQRTGQQLLGLVGGPGLRRFIAGVRPDVVVSTYPVTTEALGWLRRHGQLSVPACSAITDLSGLGFWAARGLDLYLITHPESEAEVRRRAGKEAAVRCVRGLTSQEFEHERDGQAARGALGLPDGKVVLVSGGGWGVGDLESAVRVALTIDEVSAVVCLCGRNNAVRAGLERVFAPEARVRVEGFTDQMGDWLAAADVLVHSTAGLTVLEAQVRGCAVISFGWGRGHIRLNNEAYRRVGMAQVVDSAPRLRPALERALAAPRTPDLSYGRRPSAAGLVLALLRAEHPGHRA